MIKSKSILSLCIIIIFVFSIVTGCSSGKPAASATPSTGASTSDTHATSDDFDPSTGIDENGLWANIKAADHVEIKDYMGILIPRDIHTITEESVKTEVDSILAGVVSEKQIKDRAVVDGDTVNIDFIGSIDGVPFEGGNTNGEGADVTIGVTQYIDDFLEQIIGHTPGESFDVEVTFPEDYGVEELNGRDAVFAVTLNYIIETSIPELSDGFVAENLSEAYGWNTISEMETDIHDRLQSSSLSRYIQEYLIENATIKSLPDSMLKYQENSMIQYLKDEAGYYNMDIDEFLITYVGVRDTEELLELYLEDNKQNAELHLILQAIAEERNITVTDNDVAQYFKKYTGTEDYSLYKESLGMPYLKMNVLNQAVIDYIQSNSVLE